MWGISRIEGAILLQMETITTLWRHFTSNIRCSFISQRLHLNQQTAIMRASDLPDFKDMPPVKGMPRGCAWGLFDKNGKRDQVGKLNLLTPGVALEAKEEIQTGESVALKYGCHPTNQRRMQISPDNKSSVGLYIPCSNPALAAKHPSTRSWI